MNSTSYSQPLVVLLNPDWRKLPCPGHFRPDVPYFPLELMYVESSLRRAGLHTVMADMWGRTISDEALQCALKQAVAVIVTTAPTYIFWRAGICDVDFPRTVISELKVQAPQAAVIAIGPQGTALPETMGDSGADFIVRGEPELVCSDLVHALINGRADDCVIPGVCRVRDKRLVAIAEPAVVEDLGLLPELDLESIRPGSYGQTCYEASRGCPFSCSFCFRIGFREKFRVKPLERIRSELTQMKQAGYQYIAMIDEIFGANPQWLEGFCEIVRPLGLYWGMQTRTECLNDARIRMLKDSGCVDIELGLESADPDVSRGMNKSIDHDHLRRNILSACDAGINHVRVFCVFGAPGETRESLKRTADFMMQFAHLPAVQADVFPLMPLPGTALWELGRSNGYELNSWGDMRRYTGVICNAFNDPTEIEREIEAFYQRWEAARSTQPPSPWGRFRKAFRNCLRRQ